MDVTGAKSENIFEKIMRSIKDFWHSIFGGNNEVQSEETKETIDDKISEIILGNLRDDVATQVMTRYLGEAISTSIINAYGSMSFFISLYSLYYDVKNAVDSIDYAKFVNGTNLLFYIKSKGKFELFLPEEITNRESYIYNLKRLGDSAIQSLVYLTEDTFFISKEFYEKQTYTYEDIMDYENKIHVFITTLNIDIVCPSIAALLNSFFELYFSAYLTIL